MGSKESFRAEHGPEPDLYDAAGSFLRNSFPGNVPGIDKLKAERGAPQFSKR